MNDRVVQYPHRYKLMAVDGQADTFDLVAVPGEIADAGTLLNKSTLLSDETARIFGLEGDVAVLDRALTASYVPASYLMFCANTNTDSLDSAFGKNNEDKVLLLGLQLSMYSKFKEGEGAKPFANLIRKTTLNDIVLPEVSGTYPAVTEVRGDKSICAIIALSPFARSKLSPYVPCYSMDNCGIVSAAAKDGVLKVPVSGMYRVFVTINSNSSESHGFIERNGTEVLITIHGFNITGAYANVYLSKGDLIKLRVTSVSPSTITLPHFVLLSDVDSPPSEPLLAGDIPFALSYNTSIGAVVVTVPFTGSYKIKLDGYSVASSYPLTLYVNDVAISPSIYSLPYISPTVHTLNKGDVVKALAGRSNGYGVISLCCNKQYKFLGGE